MQRQTWAVLRRFSLFWLLAFGALGCRVDREPMMAAHVQRAAAINDEYDGMLAKSAKEWASIERRVEAQREHLVEVLPGSEAPKTRVVAEYLELWGECSQLSEAEASACQEEVKGAYYEALGLRYFKADVTWVFSALERNQSADLETLLTFSHNARLGREIREQRDQIEAHRKEYRRTIEGFRQRRLAHSQQRMDAEIEAAEESRRRTLAAIGAGLRAVGESMRRTSSPSREAASTYRAAGAGGCSSDFSCGSGQTCVKNNYSSSGVCMKAVNEYGGPSYELPRLDSVGPKTPSSSDCKFMTDCPVGFRCDTMSGACVK